MPRIESVIAHSQPSCHSIFIFFRGSSRKHLVRRYPEGALVLIQHSQRIEGVRECVLRSGATDRRHGPTQNPEDWA